jgi:hypothetical protein
MHYNSTQTNVKIVIYDFPEPFIRSLSYPYFVFFYKNLQSIFLIMVFVSLSRVFLNPNSMVQDLPHNQMQITDA